MCPNKTETRLQVTWVYGVTKRGCPKSFGFRHDVSGTGHIAESCGQESLDIDINGASIGFLFSHSSDKGFYWNFSMNTARKNLKLAQNFKLVLS